MAWTTPRTWVAANTLTAAQLNTDIRDNLNAGFPDAVTSASWVPTVNGSTSGSTDPADAGREYRIGPLQFCWAYWLEPDLNAGQGGPVVGTLQVTLPTASSGVTAAAAGGQVVGTWRFHDDSTTTASLSGAVYLSAGGTVRFGLPEGNVLTDSSYTTAANDKFSIYVCYPVA